MGKLCNHKNNTDLHIKSSLSFIKYGSFLYLQYTEIEKDRVKTTQHGKNMYFLSNKINLLEFKTT